MIREEKNALVLLLLFGIGAFVLWTFVLQPALTQAIAPAADATATDLAAEPPVDPLLDARPRAAKRMVTARALLRDAATGLPVVGTTIRVTGVEDIAEPIPREVGDGMLLVEYLPPDALFAIEFQREGYRSRTLHQLRGDAKATLELGVVALSPERSLSGDIRDIAGAGLAKVRVGAFALPESSPNDDAFERARQLAEALRSPPAASGESDSEGRFKLTKLGPRPYAVHLVREDLAPVALPRIDLQFEDAKTRVVLGGAPRGRARLNLDDGSATTGAVVTVIAATMPQDGAISAALCFAGADGTIAFKALAPIPHFVFVSGNSAATCGFGPLVFPAESEVKLTALRGIAAVGLVVDAYGVPIKGATVEARGAQRGAIRVSAETDADGRFRLNGLPIGAARVRVRARGFATDEQTVPIASFGAEHKAILYRGGVLTGTVSAEGKPVLGARITILAQDARAVTDERGRFRIEGLSPGPTRAVCSTVGFTSTESTLDIALGSETNAAFDLQRGGEVRVRVLDAADASISGVRIAVIPVDDKEQPRIGAARYTVTDDQGLARCRDLTNGTRLVVVASKRGFASARSEAFVLGPEHLKRGFALTLTPGASITGTIRDEKSNPLKTARVYAESLRDDPLENLLSARANSETACNANGTYELSDLPIGEFRVVAEAVGFRRTSTSKVPLIAGDRRTDVDLALPAARAVFGAVESPDGRPVPMARVTLQAHGAKNPKSAIRLLATDFAGRFYFLAPDARPFTLTAEADGFLSGKLDVANDEIAPPHRLILGSQ